MSIEAALFGTLGRDAELKTSSKGKPHLRANIAVSEGEATTWVNAMVFDQAAVEGAAKLVKGARIYLEGRLQLSEWTDREGRHDMAFRLCPGTVACRRSDATDRNDATSRARIREASAARPLTTKSRFSHDPPHERGNPANG